MAFGNMEKVKDHNKWIRKTRTAGNSGRTEQEIQKKEHVGMNISCKVIKTNSQIAEQKPIGHFIYQRNNSQADEKSTSIF